MHRIEITGETVADLIANVLAAAASFTGTSTAAVARATTPKAAPKSEPSFVEEIKNDDPEQAAAEQAEVAAEATETKPTRSRTRTARTPAADAAPAEEKAPARSTPKAEPEVSEAILRNLVLKLMNAKGRDTVETVLGKFGIKRATEIDDARAAELVTALEDAARP